jgi:hypothetical protein
MSGKYIRLSLIVFEEGFIDARRILDGMVVGLVLGY